MKTLVAYFSAEGTTANVAKEFAQKNHFELLEIIPKTVYSKSDINWKNPLSRCNKEQLGGKDVPISCKIEDFDSYDTIYLGFPIWYGQAPRVIHTFCKDYNWEGKTVHLFATSGGSGIGKTAEKLRPSLCGNPSLDAKLVRNASEIM
ncbi:Flavodoxin [Lachnospiraceae bacterium XBB1006]|nr:Flavodoxin [Lachnospiraceae bacterium XBB1006]